MNKKILLLAIMVLIITLMFAPYVSAEYNADTEKFKSEALGKGFHDILYVSQISLDKYDIGSLIVDVVDSVSIMGNALTLTGNSLDVAQLLVRSNGDVELSSATNKDLILQPSSGNVGIGTDNPTSKLYVQSGTSPSVIIKKMKLK